MIPSTYSRLFVAGAILSILVLFSQVLLAQTPTISQTVSELPPSSERWALVIGINKYDDPALNPLYGQNDAKKIAADLQQYAGFDHDQIFVLTDDQPKDHQPSRERILWWLSVLKQNASPQGLLLVFFSGHGIESQGESFLMPKEAHLNFDKTYLEQNAVPVEVVSKSLRKSLAKQVIVLVDACRNNPYSAAGKTSNPMTRKFANAFDYEKQNKGIEAYATIFSTSLGQESYQYHSEEMGYFSWVLDQALTGAYGTGQLTLANLTNYLQEKVPKLVSIYNPGREQKPDLRLGGYLPDRLVLVGTHAPSPSPATVSAIPSFPPPQPAAPVKETATEVGTLSALPRIAVWAVGWDRSILHTDDGGLSWKTQSFTYEGNLESIAFATPRSGWVVGMYGSALHTEDGGVSWKSQDISTEKGLNSVAFATPQSGWVVGWDGTILHTEDGGSSWRPQRSGIKEGLNFIAFATPQSGWAVGEWGTILNTEDGGSHWKRQFSALAKNLVHDSIIKLEGVIGLSSIAVCTPQSVWVVGGAGVILHTEDGGSSWKQQDSGTQVNLDSVAFATPQSGWVVGNQGIILHTEDGGISWKPQNSGSHEDLRSVAFATPRSGWVVGNGGTILHTEDGGVSWKPQSSDTQVKYFRSVALTLQH